jgi:hypothetical protein
MQLRFTSFVVINLRRGLHPQECAHAGRTKKKPPGGGFEKVSEETSLEPVEARLIGCLGFDPCEL